MSSTPKVQNLLNPVLETFFILAKNGNFSKTAQELCITQPAVSIRIKSLEEYYGIVLFDKVDKRYVLTDAGKILYHYTEKFVGLVDETKRSLSEFTFLQRGSLSLGASSNIGIYILPRLLGEFKEKFPEIIVRVSIGNTRVIEKKISSCELDLGLVEAPIRSSEIVCEPWRDEKLILVTSPSHPFAKLKKIKPEQLLEEPFVVGEKGSGTGRVLAEKMASITPNLKIVLELGSTEAVKRAVEADLGISIVGENTVSREIKSSSLKAIQIDGIELRKRFNLIYLKGKVVTPAMKEFMTSIANADVGFKIKVRRS